MLEKDEPEIMVSVIMPVYNHEEYLRQAIESVISQKTDFRYELLIGEDKSPDSSLAIIQEYEELYPNILRVYARKENMGGLKNSHDLRMRSRGKYLIQLEGDDYWTDDRKLQKQVDFLEEHPEYIACAHRFRVVNRQGEVYEDRDFECQFFQDNPYTKEVFESGLMMSHINTILCRNVFIDKEIDTDFWTTFLHIAPDYTIHAVLVLNGSIYCMPDYMSCYRKVVDADSSSFSARQEANNKRDLLFRSTVELETILNQNYTIDCSARKKAVFAGAVFKWYRERNSKNLKVVKNIICCSGERLKYSMWFVYLVGSRFWMNITGRKTERVKF